jgi:tetratricopeptide (TPR) repeat protein
VFREAIRQRPGDTQVHEQFGWFFYLQRLTAESIAHYREATRLQPDQASAHRGLAMGLRRQGTIGEAIAEYQAAMRLEPDNAEFLNYMAWELVEAPKRPRQEYEMGLLCARSAVELARANWAIANTLVVAQSRVGNWAESLEAGKRLMVLASGSDANDGFVIAMAHWQIGEKDEARKWFDKSVKWTKEKDPRNAGLRQFWTEAAELLGQPGPETPVQGSPPAPAVEKTR